MGVLVTLVRVKLVEGFLLILLRPSTVRSIHTTIDTSGIGAHTRETTTLLEGALTNIHTTSVTHTVRLTTTILGTETVLHEFLIRLGSNLNSGTVRVRTVMTVDTGGWAVHVSILLIVTITLESSGILRHRLG